MPIDPSIPQCKHIKVNGLRCGSPSLKGRKYCYFHYEVTRPLIRTDIPVLEDAGSVQYSLNRLAEYILEKRIDYKQASLLLWLMQIASSNARNARLEPFLKEDIVRDHPDDAYFPNSTPQDPVDEVEEPVAEDERSQSQGQEPEPEPEPEPELESEPEPEPRSSSAISANSALKAVNPKPETRNPKPPHKPPTREELAEAEARAIEKFRNTPYIEEAPPNKKRRRRS